MTDQLATVIVGCVAAIPLTIAALGTFYISMRNGAKADVIIGHVNSEKTAAEGRELTLKAERKLLLDQNTELKAQAALLAQALALNSRDARSNGGRSSDTGHPQQVEVVNAPLEVKVEP